MQNTSTGTILIVDDEIQLMEGMRDFLLALGYRVTGCTSAGEALDALAERRHDLMITDLLMPEMDGIALMKRAKGVDPLMICIVVTGHGTIQNAVDAMREGAFDFITKPLNWKILRVIISRALDIRRLMELEEEMRVSRDHTRAYARRLAEIQERERQRIAREFHDGFGQNLVALGLSLNALRESLTDRETGRTDQRLIDALGIVSDMTVTVRDIIHDFRPSVLDDFGLLPALTSLGDTFAKRTRWNISVEGDDGVRRLSDFDEITLYRIVQEALTNAAKHAGATNILIRLRQSEEDVLLEITDDGVGFDAPLPALSKEPPTWGLFNMRERARAIGGTLDIESKRGHGTRIVVRVKRSASDGQ